MCSMKGLILCEQELPKSFYAHFLRVKSRYGNVLVLLRAVKPKATELVSVFKGPRRGTANSRQGVILRGKK